MQPATFSRQAALPAIPVPTYALAALVPLLLHLALVQLGVSPVLDGGLVDTDTYMRLTRVTDLHASGAWFDSVVHRSNAPYGDDLNWTRPLDAILLLGTWLLRPWFGFDDALFRTAAAIGPLGHLAVGFAAAWAFAPLVPAAWRPMLAVAVFAQVELYFESLAGRADHHHLILVLAVLQAGLIVRALLAADGTRHAATAGVAAGLGVWVSVELLLPLALSTAALGLAWAAAANRDAARPGRAFAGALTLTVGIAVMIERPPSGYGAIEYDKVSIVHVALAFAIAAVWTALAALDAQERRPRTVQRRAAALAVIAAACGAVFVGLFPSFLLGPTADVAPDIMTVFLNGTMEMRPLWPGSLNGLGDLLVNLGPVLAAIPGMVWLARSRAREPQDRAWLYTGVLVAVYAPLALPHQRFAPLAAVMAVPFVIHGLVALGRLIAGTGTAFRAAATVCVMLLPGLLGIALMSAPAAGAAGPLGQRCAALGTARWMAANLPPGLVMAHLNQGPLLLYWTRNSVVSGPYHRNRDGIRDGFAFFASTDDRDAKRIAATRGVDYVLLCPGEDRAAAQIPDSLARRLDAGAVPVWLRPVAIPDSRFRLFRVMR
jgi:hypothetical protein